MFWFDNLTWYLNILIDISCFYTIFYAGYYAGKNDILSFISEDFGENLDG